MRSIVFLLWLFVIPALAYHFRKTQEVKEFINGFITVWHSVIAAEDKQEDHNPVSDAGVCAGVISLIVAVILLLIFAGFTIYWAG